ncbi:MAG: hypothetical protein ACRDSL_20840 [Pseudonocardiaceae bacterium]
MAQGCNVVLERLLARAGWSPESLGDHLNRLATTLGLKVHVHRRYPRRWVYAERNRATPRVPRDPLPSLVCLLLYQRLGEPVTPPMLGWPVTRGVRYVPADDGLHQSWDGAGAIAALSEVVDADSMERRHFMTMTGLSLTAVAHQWLLDPARVAASVLGTRTDHAVVDDLERVTEVRRRLDDTLGGGSLLPAIREDLRLVLALLRNSSYTQEVGQRLHAVAAEFARIAGLRAFDSNDHPLAQRYFLAGLRAAHSSGDRALGANILTCMARQAEDHDPRDAVRLTESALAGARELTPALAAAVHAHLAGAAARAGEQTTAARAQGRMFELTATVDPAAEPPYIYWWSDAEAQLTAGGSALSLGRPREAEAHYRDALARIDPSFPRDRVLILTRLAQARVRLRELDGACRAATEAATTLRRLDSPHKLTQLAEFRKAAQPYANTTQIKNFDAKFADLLRPASV